MFELHGAVSRNFKWGCQDHFYSLEAEIDTRIERENELVFFLLLEYILKIIESFSFVKQFLSDRIGKKIHL